MTLYYMEHETKIFPDIDVWKPVRDFEGLYEVSNLARIRSVDICEERISKKGFFFIFARKGKVLQPQMSNNGYLCVCLHKNKKRYNSFVHRIVAEAFIPNPDNLPEVNHKDECKTNNNPSNLEWCDHRYNQVYGTKIERRKAKVSRPFQQFTLDGRLVCTFMSTTDLVKFGFRPGQRWSIRQCLKGESKTAYGYQWRYI